MRSRSYRCWTTTVILTVALLILASSVFAASVGRIKGIVTDVKTGEALIGVSIQIEGTTRGAKTDSDGNFLILSVSPGSYNLIFSAVGYGKIKMTDVAVVTDQTTERDIQMKSVVVDLGKVTIVKGVRQGIDFNATGTSTVMTQQQITSAPVASVVDLLAKETGITMDADGELHIRGGRAGETTYLVDGVNYSDPLGGRAPVDAGINISSSAILELQVIKDGFDPEYGEALSGIVKITSPTGSPEVTRTSIRFDTDDFGSKDLNKYSENYDVLEFTIMGPDPFFTNRILPALGINYFEDKDFTFYVYSRAYKTDTRTAYSNYGTPATAKTYPDLNILGIGVPERQQNQYIFNATLAFNPTSNMAVKGMFKGTWNNGTSFLWSHRYTPATAPVYEQNIKIFSFELKQILSKSTDYEINVSYYGSRWESKPGDPNHPGEGLDPDQMLFSDEYETFTDINNNYVFDSYEPFLNIWPDSVRHGAIWIPQRNPGDIDTANDNQVGGFWFPMYDMNNNGVIDGYEGEPFVDMNGNGMYDIGDQLTKDVNGNNYFDEAYRDVTSPTWTNREEPYIDGDSSLGEPYTDINRNGVYDLGIDRWITALDNSRNQDLDRNNVYTGPSDPWSPGIPFIDYNNNGVFDRKNNRFDPGEPYIDVNKNGRHDLGGDNSSAFLLYGYRVDGSSNEWAVEEVDKYTAKGNFKKALGRAHEIKAGFEFRSEKVAVSTISRLQRRDDDTLGDYNPYVGRGLVRDFYSRNPKILVLYFRDKIEYGSLVASLGLRGDLFFQSDLKGVATIQDQTGHNIQTIRNKFSPRISINYPISERAMIRFNYGHFYELAGYTRMYRTANPFERGDVPVVGNPNLDYTKTVNYTFGVQYAFTDEYSLKVNGFYKDYFDIIATTSYINEGGQALFSYYDNTDYARIRGLEMEITREASRFINGTLSYEYTFAFGKSSSDAENYLLLLAGNDIPIDENPLAWDLRHRVRLWLQLYFTNRDHPKLFGLSIPNNWDMSVTWSFQSGFPFTPDKSFPGMKLETGELPQTNSMRLPSTAQTDIKLNKRFQISSMTYSFQVWVNNLFDNHNVVRVSGLTGRPDTSNNNGSGLIGGGTERTALPTNWGRGRQIIVGVGLRF